MKKYTILVLTILMTLFLAACRGDNGVLNVTKTYDITSDIHSLDIQINAADFVIEHGSEFSVESNLKYLTVHEKNGVLTIVDEAKKSTYYTDATLKLFVPEDVVFENVDIITGAGKLTVDLMSANSLELILGAGNARFECLNAYSDIDIKGGAGKITISDGALNNLELKMGVGELNLTAALLGNSDLEFGVGESNITLLGSEDDYTLDIEKGIGNITVNGMDVSGFESGGKRDNYVEIEGGVGSINLFFQGLELI